jgi:hypothetical protein
MGLIDDAIGERGKGNGADRKRRVKQHSENDERLSRPSRQERGDAACGHLEEIPVGLRHLASLPVVAGLVPATPIVLARCLHVRGRRDKPGDDHSM